MNIQEVPMLGREFMGLSGFLRDVRMALVRLRSGTTKVLTEDEVKAVLVRYGLIDEDGNRIDDSGSPI